LKVVSVRSCDAEAVLKSQAIINNHNNLPNSKTTLRTPAEIITGEKFNFLADLQAPFGSVILVNHIRHANVSRVHQPYEKSSPTIPLEVAKMQLGLASYHDAEVEVFDIPVAYLNVYLKPDKRQSDEDPSIHCKNDTTS
jgi:hypothetical protein